MLTKKYTGTINAILKVIPEDELNLVISRGQLFSDEMWFWGDRALLWIEIALRSGIACTKDEVYSALSQVSGITKRSLRLYAAHCDFFEPEVREKFEPLLFTHFAVAKRFGPRWEGVLKSATDYLEKTGRLPSAEWLEWKFSRNAQPTLKADTDLERVTDEMVEGMQAEDDLMPDEPDPETGIYVTTESQARSSFARMETTISLMEDILPWLPVSDSQRVRLYEAMSALRVELEEAMKEVAHPRPG